MKIAGSIVHHTVGHIPANVTFCQRTQGIRFYLVHTLSRELFLVIYFMVFKMFANIYSSAPNGISLWNKTDNNIDALRAEQLQKIDLVISMFPYYSRIGLGKHIITYSIDTRDEGQMKDWNYSISPGAQKLMLAQCIDFKGCLSSAIEGLLSRLGDTIFISSVDHQCFKELRY